MVNLGIYGIVRVGDGAARRRGLWWWLTVAGLGVVSALFGAIHAAASSDLKRLLAYSTVDNMGLVLIGVGASGALDVSGHHTLAALALIAALFQLVSQRRSRDACSWGPGRSSGGRHPRPGQAGRAGAPPARSRRAVRDRGGCRSARCRRSAGSRASGCCSRACCAASPLRAPRSGPRCSPGSRRSR